MALPDSEIDTFGRVPEYIAMLKAAQERGECLLDIDNFEQRQGKNVLSKWGGWVLAKALFPYENTEQSRSDVVGHSLIFPERHITRPQDMEEQDVLAQWRLFNESAEIFGARTGALFMRYSFEGNYAGAGATLAHVHAHIIAPHLDDQTHRVPGANSPESKQVKLWVG